MSLSSEMNMETKLIAMILGVALVLATAATVYTQSAFAARNNHNPCSVEPCPPGGGNGVAGQGNNGKHLGQLAHGGIVIRGN